MSASHVPRPVGRPASATPDEVLDLATRQFLGSERVDVQAIASELGLSRATIYRWFGSREGLLGAMLVAQFMGLIDLARARTDRSGVLAVLDTVDQTMRWLADNDAYRAFIATEQATAGRILTSSEGPVQPKVVGAVAELLEQAVEEGYHPRVEIRTFAYAIVRLSEAFIYQDAVAGLTGNADKLRDVLAALLGVDAARPAARP